MRASRERYVLGLRQAALASLVAWLLMVPAASAEEDTFRVSVLGDSVAAGFGIDVSRAKVARCAATIFGLGRPTGACDNHDAAWPARFGAGLSSGQTDGLPVVVDNQAIAGAQTGNFMPRKRLSGRVDHVIAQDPDVVLITLGANDILSSPRCATNGRCVTRRLRAKHTNANLTALFKRLDRGTGADIYITEYYYLDQDLSSAVEQLNDVIDRAARPFGTESVSVVNPPAFRGHGCRIRGSGSWMLPPTKDICLHPNAIGQQKLANAALATFSIQNPTNR